jgi:hypothetical protein
MNGEPAAQPKGWLARNWKWAVPGGCLVLLLLAVGGAVALIALLMGGMKSSDAYRLGFEQASRSPEVIAAVGSPVKSGWWLTGSIRVSETSTDSSGEADIQFPISGPKGQATVRCQSTKSAGRWQVRHLVVVVAGSKQAIELVRPENGPSKEPGRSP